LDDNSYGSFVLGHGLENGGMLKYTAVDIEFPGNNSSDDEVVSLNNFKLKNYPNPFNPITTISFEVPKNDMISLEIFNLKGELVKTLIKRNVSKGIHRIIWNGTNKKGQKVNSGIYLIKLQTSGKVISQKIILLK